MSNLDQDGYTGEQRQHLDQAKRKHRETTASAQRALQVCWLQARESGNTAFHFHLFASCIAAVRWHVTALVHWADHAAPEGSCAGIYRN